MPCRWEHLQNVYLGFLKSNVPLIEFHKQQFCPFSVGDDIGMYVLIPKIATFFNLSLETATHLFFGILFWIPVCSALIGFFSLYQSWYQRLITCVSFGLFFLTIWHVQDLYLAYIATALITVPWTLYYYKKGRSPHFLFYMVLGFLFGIVHFIRAYSWLPSAAFLMPFIFSKHSVHQIAKVLLFLGLGYLVPHAYFSYQYQCYEAFVTIHCPEQQLLTRKHPFWHTVYLGFGFLKQDNPHNIRYDDNWGFNHVQETRPNIKPYTPEYEAVLKQHTFDLIKQYPHFVIYTLAAKLGILLLFFIIYANIGLLCALFTRQDWLISLAFFLALAISALFPLISLPTIRVCALSFITYAWLYGLIQLQIFFELFFEPILFD